MSSPSSPWIFPQLRAGMQWGEGGKFTILNFVISEGEFRAFVGDQQLAIQCEDHRSIIQVNHTSNHVSWLPRTSKIPTALMPPLALGNKTAGLEDWRSQKPPVQLKKWLHEQFLLTGSCTWFLQGTQSSTRDNSHGRMIYLTNKWNQVPQAHQKR